jgi:hypothetical protein
LPDQRSGGVVGIADRVDDGGATAQVMAQRSKILTFHADKTSRLRLQQPRVTSPAE